MIKILDRKLRQRREVLKEELLSRIVRSFKNRNRKEDILVLCCTKSGKVV